MLIKGSRFESTKIRAADGPFGTIQTFLFDQERWVVRYVVVKYGFLLWGGTVLVSPVSVDGPVSAGEALRTKLTKDQLKSSPSADLAKPISRRKEEEFHRYHEIPVYWSGAGLWGTAMTPTEVGAMVPRPGSQSEPLVSGDDQYYLRSTAELEGYVVHARDGVVGEVSDFIIEDTTWAIRYLRINPSKLAGLDSLIISPHWISDISWLERKTTVDMTVETLAAAPAVKGEPELSREDEEHLHDYYGQARYWK